jgi:hypothetical protein
METKHYEIFRAKEIPVKAEIKEPLPWEVSIREIIKHYSSDEFGSMKEKINVYGKAEFFTDLWTFLERQTWRDVLNKYLFYVRISLQYWQFP